MTHLAHKLTLIIAALIITVFSVNLLTVMDVYATQNPNGNNGTLKVHEKGTPDKTPSNDPKVCAFNLEGFDFDAAQSGYIVISPDNTNTAVATLAFGPTDGTGYAASAYVNDGISGFSIANGKYEATLYGKKTGNPSLPDLANEKAKSKVFTVGCAPQPKAPTVSVQAGPCVLMGMAMGTVTGSVTNTADETKASVIYTVTITNQATAASQTATLTVTDGATKAFSFTGLTAGTYSVSATGNDGTAAQLASATVTNCIIMLIPVTPETPSSVELCGTASDTYTIPAKPGVVYSVNGTPTAAGTYAGSGTVLVTAQAAAGFILNGTATWTLMFDNTGCPVTPTVPTHVDVCGKKNDSYTIPVTTGVDYFVNGKITAAGTYKKASGTVVITAVAQPGYALAQNAPASWTINFSKKSCKVTICHRTASYTNPYNKIRVSLKAVDGAGKGDHFKEHQGPIFNPSLPLHTEWGDIIPPTASQPDGLNWTAEGQAILNTKDCDVVLVEATPAEPTFNDVCSTQNDTYTIPTTTGVNYFVNGSAVATPAGTYAASGTITIMAIAKDGYILDQAAQATWSHDFTNQACPAAVITATAACTTLGASVILKNTGDADGTSYVNGMPVVVPAKSQIEKPLSLLAFKASVVVTIGGENTILNEAIDCTPGRGSVGPIDTPTPTAPVAQPGALPRELPMTGPSTLLSQLLTMISLAIATYGVTYYLQGRRELYKNN